MAEGAAAYFFASNKNLLKLTGFWIYDKAASEKYLQYGYNVFWACYVYFFYIPAEILYLFYNYNDLDKFLRALRDIGNHLALIYKAVNFLLRRRDLLHLMDTLQDDYSYEIFADFHPEDIIKEAKRDAAKWTRYFLYFVNAICLSMFLSGCYIFFFAGSSQYDLENDTLYSQKQPVNTISPFGFGTRKKFFVTFIWTIIALTVCAWMIVALDSLFITLMSGINAHLKILSGAFKTLRPRCLKRLQMQLEQDFLHDPAVLQEEMHKELNKCIKHLQTIYRVSNKLEVIYNGQTLFQTFISLGEMCFSLYLVSQIDIENVGNEVTYLFATSFELLMYCWFGNKITEASLQVKRDIFESDWLSTNVAYRKQIIFTMTRMQKPINITIGKITPLTFRTFLTMVRGAYSFFTFLKQRNIEHSIE